MSIKKRSKKSAKWSNDKPENSFSDMIIFIIFFKEFWDEIDDEWSQNGKLIGHEIEDGAPYIASWVNKHVLKKVFRSDLLSGFLVFDLSSSS